MKKFQINNKEYEAKQFTPNVICKLDDYGVPLDMVFSERVNDTIKVARAYFAICANISLDQAGDEIEAHYLADGDMTSFNDALLEAVEKSGFFHKLKQMEEEEASKNTSKKK